jgi:hypothetical protein
MPRFVEIVRAVGVVVGIQSGDVGPLRRRAARDRAATVQGRRTRDPPGGEFIFDDDEDDGPEVRYVSRAEIVRTRYAVT